MACRLRDALAETSFISFCRVAETGQFGDSLRNPTEDMHSETEITMLKIRLTERLLREFKSRAAAQEVTRDEYAAAALHYALQDDVEIDDGGAAGAAGETDIYLSARIPGGLREMLLERSDRSGRNIASFCGDALAGHFERHERDPRELVLLFDLDVALAKEDGDGLAEEVLVALLERHGPRLVRGVSVAFMANWLFSRFRTRIGKVRRGGGAVSFSPGLLKELLGKTVGAK